MKTQPHRLAAAAPHGLGGALLDRAKPLRFHLNGRLVEGFAGDTVLSAALANGIQSAGRHADTPLALDETFAPLAVTRGTGPLPMDRTPALDGADFTTIGIRRDPIGSRGLLGAIRHRLVGPARTLNHRGRRCSAAPCTSSARSRARNRPPSRSSGSCRSSTAAIGSPACSPPRRSRSMAAR
jgi:sarcosine oxidase subunit alpha